MLPAEKALVQRLENKPFALVAVNSDPADQVASMLQKENIPWRNAVDGSTSGPIATEWGVSAWPTIYLIDHEGVIRFKGHRYDDKEVDALVEAAEKAAKGAPAPTK